MVGQCRPEKQTPGHQCPGSITDIFLQIPYKEECDKSWENFKKGMERDLDGLKSSLKNTTIKNG